jgi:hypothetical protein
LVNFDFFDQYLALDPLDPTEGWGIFANIGLADHATNPMRWFLNLRLGGERPLPCRSADSFGVGYYNLGIKSKQDNDFSLFYAPFDDQAEAQNDHR